MLKTYRYPEQKSAIVRKWTKAPTADPDLDRAVWDIINAVRTGGGKALSALTERFDGVKLTPAKMRIPPEKLEAAWESLPPDLQRALTTAHKRILRFHARQKPRGFRLREKSGPVLEQRFLPLQSVGLYVPGGKAAYPSTVLMCAAPAHVAGVERVVMVTPPHQNMDLANRATWGAAWLAGVREAYCVGGAQAVAALAFGAGPIPQVDKVVGPGNKYVATAKKLLYGQIDIDSVAGPSEVMILADVASARPDLIAADLLAQAEHDEEASAILVVIGAPSKAGSLIQAVERAMDAMLSTSPRQAIARASLKANGVAIVVPDGDSAVELTNLRAPEHLEILTADPRALADRVRNAAAIFLGPWCPEAYGDYIAGPNHTLPTGGTARFFSPLGVMDFMKSSNLLEADAPMLRQLGPAATAIADVEGLVAHATSLRLRLADAEKDTGKKKR